MHQNEVREASMRILGFNVASFKLRKDLKKTSREKVDVLPEALDRLKSANHYFDANLPRAHSQAELDLLFKRPQA
jgi:hypothetical protein